MFDTNSSAKITLKSAADISPGVRKTVENDFFPGIFPGMVLGNVLKSDFKQWNSIDNKKWFILGSICLVC